MFLCRYDWPSGEEATSAIPGAPDTRFIVGNNYLVITIAQNVGKGRFCYVDVY